jgi:hypothetical protein
VKEKWCGFFGGIDVNLLISTIKGLIGVWEYINKIR